MSRTITRSPLSRSVVFTMALALLAGCDESGQFVAMQAFKSNTDVTGNPAAGREIKTVERDVESPDVFSASESGLWDGRPSLGGVWVAHPDVTDPERVIIRNADNDKFVVGALFRRERDIPGPRIQISSDAAEALGMLAGAPATLNVTALRKEEVSVASEAAPVAAETVAAPSEVTETPLDPIQSAAAAIDAPAPSAGITPAASAAPTPVAATAPARATASSLAKPFIQIGIFSIEANAERTAKQMRGAGIIPIVKTFERDGKPFWRVVVGPASTSGERGQLLGKIKEEGFTDAYAVSN